MLLPRWVKWSIVDLHKNTAFVQPVLRLKPNCRSSVLRLSSHSLIITVSITLEITGPNVTHNLFLYIIQRPRKLWKSGTVGASRGEESVEVGGPEVLHWLNFWKYKCISVQFGAFLGHQVIKSGTENRCFTIPLLKVGWNSPFLPYRFHGPWYYSVSIESHYNSQFSVNFHEDGCVTFLRNTD